MQLQCANRLGRALALAIIVCSNQSPASKRIINPHGGGNYLQLDVALDSINKGLNVDTLLIDGANGDSVTYGTDMASTNPRTLVIRSTSTDPDSFPLLKRNSPLGWPFLAVTNLTFENFLFRDAKITGGDDCAWTNANSANTYRFKSCIIKDQSADHFFMVKGGGNPVIRFENCLFEGNAQIFKIEIWGGSPYIQLVNCTFDKNTQIFNTDLSGTAAANVSIMNCIFSGNSTTFPGSGLKGKTISSLTSENVTGYGSGCVSNTDPRYKISSSRAIPSDWGILYSSSPPTPRSPACNIGNASDAPTVDMSGFVRIGNPDAGCWEAHVRDFTWDASSSNGIQAGSGSWGGASASDFWTPDSGASRIAWRGAGNSAAFGGSDGVYAIAVGGTHDVDSLAFTAGGYTLTGGTLRFTDRNSVLVDSGKTAVVASVIAGSIGFSKRGDGALTLGGANTYTGGTAILRGILSASQLGNGGGVGSVGADGSAAGNLVIDGGELAYTGAGETCDRLFTVGAAGAVVSASGTGALTLSNTGAIAFSGSGGRALTLSGTNSGANTLAALIADGAGATSLAKSGTGTWFLSGANTYTGATTVSGGTLIVGGAIGASAVTVASGAALGGTGNFSGAVTVNGTLTPGASGAGIMTVNGNLTFGSGGSYECTLSGTAAGSGYDQVVVTGSVTLASAALALTLGFTPTPGQALTIIDNKGTGSVSGTFADLPEGKRIILSYGGICYYCSISYAGGTGNDVVVTVVSIATDYTWDLSAAAGFQTGSGTWGTGSTWSADGLTLVPWPGAGYTATFAGSDGTYVITLAGAQRADSVTFQSDGYSLGGDALDLGGHGAICVAAGKNVSVASVIQGSGGLIKYGAGTLVLSAANTFSGKTFVAAGTLQLGGGGGAGSVAGPIENNGTLVFNRSDAVVIDSAISGSGTITKTGAGSLKLFSANSFTGSIGVVSGSLIVNGSLASGCSATIAAGAMLAGGGSLAGPVTAAGATISPGDGGPGKLATGALSLSGASALEFDLGARSDTVAVTGNLSLAGTIALSPSAGFHSGTYTLFTCSGAVTNNGAVIGTAPAGKGYSLAVAATSVTVVCTTAIISAQPHDTAVVLGKSGSFSISAAGTGALTYQWIKAPATAVGTSPSLSIPIAALADSGRYRCIVADSFGADTSRWVSLSIVVPPQISSQPAPDTVRVGSPAAFGIVASGTMPFSYSWYREKGVVDSLLSSVRDSLVFSAAAFGDSGGYYCIIRNAGGPVTSETVRLVVKHIPPSRAEIRPDSATVFDGDSIRFGAASAGTAPFTVAWHKTGAGIDSLLGVRDSLAFIPASLGDSGRYFCIVSNPEGSDTSNSVLLRVKHVSPKNAIVRPDSAVVFVGTGVRFSVSAGGTRPFSFEWRRTGANGDSLLTRKGDTLFIDSVAFADSGRYYCIVRNPGGADTSEPAVLKVSNLPPSAPSVSPDTAAVSAGSSVTFSVRVSGTPPFSYAWHHLKGGADSLMKAAGERLAIDSAALSDSGGYYCVIKNPAGAATSDTARLMVKNAPPSATVVMPDSIGIAAGKAAAFTVAAAGTRPFTYAWYKEREGPDSLMAAAGDTLKFRSTGIPDSGRYYCIVRNPAGADTSAPARLVIIPKPRAAFSFAPKSGTAPLDVAFSDRSAGEISARLWTFGDDSLSALLNPTHPFVKAGLFTVSLIVSGPGGSDTCRKSDSVFVYTEGQNPVRIAARFLTGTNVELTINNLGDVDTSLPPPRCDSLGIWYRPKAIPTSSIDGKILVTYRRSEFKTGRILDTVSLPGTDTVFGLMSALFWGGGTLSDFHLANGCAVLLKDTGSSGLSEAVSLLDPAEGSDTVDAFKGKILLWKDASYGGKTGLRDTLLLLPSYICPEGMIVVGRPFVFKKGSSGPPFAVGMRIDSLPANRSLRDVRIYTDSAGAAIVNWETAIDSARHLVFVVTGDLRRPFVAMIDTAPPAAEVVSDTANYAVEGGSLTDSLRIFDNIINVRWRYFAGKGDEQPLLRQEGETHRTGERIDLTLADSINALSSLTGLRAFVLVGDAVHWDTIDLSRSVARAQSDKQTASAGVWTPVYPTSRLFQKSADSLIARLSSSGTARYDARYYRLFRWVAYEGNRDQTDKWVEFNPSQGGVRSLFTLEPGRLLWLKPRGDLSFDLDSGATLSLRDTFKILLPPQQWTDFGMPLRFGVRMEEILSASGSGADSVLFFRWRKNDASSRFMLEPLYVPGMPDKLDRSAPVEYLPKEGYSFFNRSSRIIVVRIPPVPASTAKPLGKKTAKTGETWCGKFVARDQGGASLPAVYFGYAAGIKISAYPLVPSFGGIRLCVFDRSAGKSYGHHIGEDAKNGLIKELRITNDADSVQHLGFRMQRVGALPGNYSVYCYDAAAKRFDTAGSISVGPKSAASRWIIIGDAAFQRRFIASKLALQFSLRSLYPNPARRAVTIRYTVPFGSEERIRIAIYSPVGKRLWEKRIEGPLVEGDHVVTWDGADSRRGPAASGLYIVRMEVIDPAGHAVKQFERRLTLVK